MPKVLWTIKLDHNLTCCHVNYLEDLTNAKGKHDFFFSAYSSFKVLEYNAPTNNANGRDRDNPICITLRAYHDNARVEEDVPSAPWH